MDYTDETVALNLSTAAGKLGQGSIDIYCWTRKRARRRGLFVCSFIYTMGILASISPALVIHLIVPPVWIIVGPWVSVRIIRAYAETREFKRGRGVCPACSAPLKFTGFKFSWPIPVTCRECQGALVALPADGDRRGIPSDSGT